MKKIFVLFFFVIFYLIYGLFLSQYDLRIIPKELVSTHPEGFHDYHGVINVHTQLSSGSGTIPEVIASAKESGLNFLILTDLNQAVRPIEWEGYHENLLVFVAGEYSYLNSRLINFDALDSAPLKGLGQSQVVMAELLSQETRSQRSGLFFLAHPLKPGYLWSGEYPPGLDGIEVINLRSMWQEAWIHSKLSFFWTLLIYPFNDRMALLRLFEHPKAETELWDELLRRRRTIGLAGADANAKVLVGNDYYLQFPSYETLFSLVRLHVLLKGELTGTASSDRDKVARAIRDGQFYMSLDFLADPIGFNTTLLDQYGQVYPLGAEVPYQEGLNLKVVLPHKPRVPFDVIIHKDGADLFTSNSVETIIPIKEPGVYRVTVRVIPTFPLPDGKKWVPWIFTNPIYIR